MKFQRQIDQLISRQASDWIEVLRSGDMNQRAAFVAWLKESKKHVNEFLAMTAVDQELNRIDAERRVDLDALIKKISSRDVQVAELRPQLSAGQARPTRGGRWKAAAVAAGIVCSLSLWFSRDLWLSQEFSTATGEQRAIALSDGSLVQLNTQSSIKVRFNDSAREIRLVKGEALFKVAADSSRPFRVSTRLVAVQALGTQFNVYAGEGETTVSVIEGKVKMLPSADAGSTTAVAVDRSPALSSAVGIGEQVKVSSNGQVQRKRVKDIDHVAAWRQRRLLFRDSTLDEMTRQFNRYNATPKFHIEGERVKQRHYSGTFDADDPHSLEQLLTKENDLVIENNGRDIFIRAR